MPSIPGAPRSFMKSYKELASSKSTPVCPKCGSTAIESVTQYGILSKCCDLWSWDRFPLVDKKTHDIRKDVGTLISQLSKAKLHDAIAKRVPQGSGVPYPTCVHPREMNEAACRKVKVVLEEMLMEVFSGEIEVR